MSESKPVFDMMVIFHYYVINCAHPDHFSNAFTLAHVYLIWRNDPPDDIFRIGLVLSLGGP